ncbi:unnamed protein product [Chrysoparadoxa australica]
MGIAETSRGSRYKGFLKAAYFGQSCPKLGWYDAPHGYDLGFHDSLGDLRGEAESRKSKEKGQCAADEDPVQLLSTEAGLLRVSVGDLGDFSVATSEPNGFEITHDASGETMNINHLDESLVVVNFLAPDTEKRAAGTNQGAPVAPLLLRTVVSDKSGMATYCTLHVLQEHACLTASFGITTTSPVLPVVRGSIAIPQDPQGCSAGGDNNKLKHGRIALARAAEWTQGRMRRSRKDKQHRGKVVVVERGGCTFEQKARVAQSEGAVALVVINSKGHGLFSMAPTIDHDTHGYGPTQSQGSGKAFVRIPAVMVSWEAGEEILHAAATMEAVGGMVPQLEATLDIASVHQVLLDQTIVQQQAGGEEQVKDWLDEVATHMHDHEHGQHDQFQGQLLVFNPSIVRGMRAPPHPFPRVKTAHNTVEVMGMGHWGALVVRDSESWQLFIIANQMYLQAMALAKEKEVQEQGQGLSEGELPLEWDLGGLPLE